MGGRPYSKHGWIPFHFYKSKVLLIHTPPPKKKKKTKSVRPKKFGGILPNPIFPEKSSSFFNGKPKGGGFALFVGEM